MTDKGIVREWHDEEGWGVIDSPATPGGCWVHCTQVGVPFGNEPRAGQELAFTWEAGQQDGFGYRATRAWPWGGEPRQRPGTTVFGDRSGAYSSTLTLTYDDSRPSTVETYPPAPTPVLGTVTVTVHETVPGRNEVRIESTGTLSEDLVDTTIAELRQVRERLAE